MSTYQERMRAYDRIVRNAKLAKTYLKKALWDVEEIVPKLWKPGDPIDVTYWTLLDAAIETATAIVGALPDDFFESEPLTDRFGLLGDRELPGTYNLSDTALEEAEKLVAAIRARRRRTDVLRKILALEDPSGRTPEEAASFAAKAAELRARHNLPPTTTTEGGT